MDNGKLCPVGWHVPSEAEWDAVISYLGLSSVAGAQMKETGLLHWAYPNSGATNESGFTGLPGGYRNSPLDFIHLNVFGFWWSSSENVNGTVNAYSLYYNSSAISKNNDMNKLEGCSVRCLKD